VADWKLTTFRADVTIPIGHPCMGGGIAPAATIVDPLEAIGFVLGGGTLDEPVAVVAVDWCEIRNEAYDAWRDALARVIGTRRQNVFVTAIHQHDAPVVDPEAQRLLEAAGAQGAVCDIDFDAWAIEAVAAALAARLLEPPQRVTHIGAGKAITDRVASNRRFVRPDRSISYHRTSASTDADAHAAPEGLVDPWLRTISFWDGDRPLLALSTYAVHPMSYYGRGEVSADFIGIARRARERALPGVVQMYASGCSGNVTAGKYNDGSPHNRPVLAARMEAAMAEAWTVTTRRPLTTAAVRSVALRFAPREGPGFSEEGLADRIAGDGTRFDQCLAAMGLSWRRRLEAGRAVDLPALELDGACIVLLPGEAYVEYQLLAQSLRPDDLVLALGYGESGTGYIPTSTQLAEGDENLGDWYWVSESAEAVLSDGLRAVLSGAAPQSGVPTEAPGFSAGRSTGSP
jgi:hypothetical protein